MSTAEFDRVKWLEDRKSAIGASDGSAILRLNPWATDWEVWAEKTGKLEHSPDTPATSAGKVLEAAVLDHAEQELGKLDRNVRIKHPHLPIASTCDALVPVANRPVEAKTTGIVGPIMGHWGDELTDQLPDYYLVQVHLQLMCTQADLAYLFALLPGRGFVQYQVEPNERLHEHLGNLLSDWWERHIVQGVEPSIQDAVPNIEVVKRLRKQKGKAIKADESLAVLAHQYDRAKQDERAAEKHAKECQAKLLIAMADAEQVELPDGRLLTHFEQTKKGHVVEPCKYRVLRFKKGE